jgi:hypothetical protein
MVWPAIIGAAGGILGGILGQKESGRQTKQTTEYLEEQRLQRFKDEGATVQEILGSPASGASAVNPGGGQILGNALQQGAKLLSEQQFQLQENEKNRQKDKEIAAVQAKTAEKVANTSANASMYGADSQASLGRYQSDQARGVADRRLGFDIRQFEEVAVPKAAEALNKTREEILQLRNNVATSDPQFVKSKILAGMGPDNMLATTLFKQFGVDIFDESIEIPPDQMVEMLITIAGQKSTVFGEAAGVTLGAKVAPTVAKQAAEEAKKVLEAIGPGKGSRGRNKPRR